MNKMRDRQQPSQAGELPTSLSRLANNTLWNLAGQLLPLIIAIAAMPPLIRSLGIDRYGFLSLALVLIGYAGLFDLGVSRAVTRLVAQRLAEHDISGAKRIGVVATTYMVLLGVLSGVLLGAFSEDIIGRWLVIPRDLQGEAKNAMGLLAASMPVVLLTSSYRSYIEAHQHFKPLNVVRILMGAFTYLGPLCAALVSPRLELVVGAMVAMRVVALIAHAWVANKHCDFQYVLQLPDTNTSRTLFSLGGWITVSNIIGPIMATMDRFILGGLVSVELVAYYSTPYDLMSRVMIIPYALMATLFPVIAGLGADPPRLRETYHSIIRWVFVCMFPVVFVTITLGGGFLRLWLGEAFASHGTIVLQILAVGVLANSLAQAPALLIQGVGRPKWMAVVHVVELPVFLLGIWYLTNLFGIAGTALTWAARAVGDCVILFALTNNWLTNSKTELRTILPSIVIACCLMTAGFFVTSPLQSASLCVLGLVMFGIFSWRIVLTPTDKARIIGVLSSRAPSIRAGK